MPKQIVLFGALIPALVPVFVLAGVLMLLLDQVFAITGLYARIWYPALFRVSLFVSLFALMGLVIY